MPSVVSQSGSTKATYTYLADGSKVQVVDASGNDFAYLGSLIYTKSGSGYTLESGSFSGGRIVNSSGTLTPYYHTTDHLGSVRMITNSSGGVVEQNDYYPYGGKHTSGRSFATLATNKYKFNGKEEQTVGGLSYLDYGARMYNNVLGRWMTQDPLGEKYYGHSPYNYCLNNPGRFVDLDGRKPDDYFNKYGIYLGSDDLPTDFIWIVHDYNNASVDAFAYRIPIQDAKLSNRTFENIIKYYDNQLGSIEGKSENVEIIVRDLQKETILMQAGRSSVNSIGPIKWGGKESISINSFGGKLNHLLNTASNIKNTLVHEYKHIPDNRQHLQVEEKELRAIETQRNHSSYKYTTKEYQENIDRYEKKNRNKKNK